MSDVTALTDDWEIRTIGSLGSVRGGKRLPKGRSLTQTPTAHPYIRVTDMQQGRVDISELRFVPEDVAPLIRAYRIFKNDIFISVAGTLGIVGRVPADLDGANLTENADRITSITCDVDYLMYSLLGEPIQNEIDSIRTVGAQPKLALGRIKQFEIPIPMSRSEQSRIAQTLRDTDDLIATLERLIAKKQAIKQGKMQQLLTGRTRLPGFTAPWTVRSLGSVGKCIRGVGYEPGVDLSTVDRPFTVRLLRANNVQDGLIELDGLQYVHERRVRSDQILKRGDIVVCMANGSRALVGKSALFDHSSDPRYTFGAFMGAFRVIGKEASPIYVAGLLKTHAFRSWLDVILSGSSINNLRPGDVEGFTCPMPSFEEQGAISQVLSDGDTELLSLRSRLAKARAIKTGMMQQLLTGRTRLQVEAVS
ncbi:restriction endonuclease subunit S [Rhodococcus sp. NPDC003318]|uniref:restriction endonuclease subunit S n=1 Tax=Rhodococcus sp. NPDC003318 TaxID=3364503 RepID=UPI00368E8F08